MVSKAMFSSNTDEWETPDNIFDALNKEFEFTLDPCASDQNHKCRKYYTKEQDGLLMDWRNNVVYVNPPYGRGIAKWVKKAFDTASTSESTVVMLLPARTDTKWFHDYIYNRAEIRFCRGRIRFGNSTHDAPFPSMVVVFRGGSKDDQKD